MGIPDVFVEHGPQALLRAKYGLDAAGIATTARELTKHEIRNPKSETNPKFK
jgi:deoxyxylulose-5-phosphate synthase